MNSSWNLKCFLKISTQKNYKKKKSSRKCQQNVKSIKPEAADSKKNQKGGQTVIIHDEKKKRKIQSVEI